MEQPTTPNTTSTPVDDAKAEKRAIAFAPIRRLMKNEGAKLVSDEAVKMLVLVLEKKAIEITKIALKNMTDDKRKRLTAQDIEKAE